MMKWSVAIVSSRETIDTLFASVAAASRATAGREAIIDVLINGNRELAEEAGRRFRVAHALLVPLATIRVWYIGVADKAHTWNEYVHRIWPGSEVAFFIDGYAEVMPDALQLISQGLADTPEALGGSGVPTIGRSAESHRKEQGSVHGNFYAVKGHVLAQLQSRGFRLPLGLYWTDGLLFAVIAFGLDPAKNKWDTKRILSHPQATWKFRPLRWWSPRDLRSHIKRMMRQAQGALENLALREYLAVQKKPPEGLPNTNSELVTAWLSAYPVAARKAFVRNPLSLIAANRLRRSRSDWTQVSVLPLQITQINLGVMHPS
jgi:hypothetical protein